MGQVSYVRDFLAPMRPGWCAACSPGFRVRPGGETVEDRGDAILRTIRAADLIEISAVTKPAYPPSPDRGPELATSGHFARRAQGEHGLRRPPIRWRR